MLLWKLTIGARRGRRFFEVEVVWYDAMIAHIPMRRGYMSVQINTVIRQREGRKLESRT